MLYNKPLWRIYCCNLGYIVGLWSISCAFQTSCMHLWLVSISAGIEIMIKTVRLQTVCPATVPLQLHHQTNLHFSQWYSFALHMDYQMSLANATSRTTNGNQNASDTEVLSLDLRFSIHLQLHVCQFSLLTWQKEEQGLLTSFFI